MTHWYMSYDSVMLLSWRIICACVCRNPPDTSFVFWLPLVETPGRAHAGFQGTVSTVAVNLFFGFVCENLL